MRYQLVLQFAGPGALTLDELIELEDELTRQLPASAQVDGHDIGSGEGNIYLSTGDPLGTFAAIRPILTKRGQLEGLGVAYRAERSNEFVRVWPEDAVAPFIVR